METLCFRFLVLAILPIHQFCSPFRLILRSDATYSVNANRSLSNVSHGRSAYSLPKPASHHAEGKTLTGSIYAPENSVNVSPESRAARNLQLPGPSNLERNHWTLPISALLCRYDLSAACASFILSNAKPLVIFDIFRMPTKPWFQCI